MQKVEFDGEEKYVMDTRFFQYAFAILESVHTQDAEFILRDLKELFSSLGVDVEGNTDTSEEAGSTLKTNILENEDTQTVAIEFTGQDDEKLKGITIYISGITVDSSVQVDNTYERGTKIGTTTNNDITIIMKDKNQSVITNVDNYLHPDTQENA